jgi:uncharacterized protein YndB with AHSA1/START domain
MSEPKFVYVSYIATTPEKLWEALTSAEFTTQYWGGRRIASDWKVGGRVTISDDEGNQDVEGEVLVADAPRELSYSWKSLTDPAFTAEGFTRVTFRIEPMGPALKLTVIHEGFAPGSKLFDAINQGWPAILSSLKSLMETGRGLFPVWKRPKPGSATAARPE